MSSRANRRGGRSRLGAPPPDFDDRGPNCWSDKQNPQTKRLPTAENAQQNPKEGQASRRADQRRADEMIGNENHDRREHKKQDGRSDAGLYNEGEARDQKHHRRSEWNRCEKRGWNRTGWATPATA